MSKRKKSHILNISTPSNDTIPAQTRDVAIEALLEQRKELRKLLQKIDGDLISLGYNVDGES